MKKRIFKQKPTKSNYNMDHRKTIYRNTKHRAGKTAAMLLLLSLLAGSILPVHGREAKVPRTEMAMLDVPDMEIAEVGTEETEASEAPKVVVTEIYHKHIGSPSAKGGCYQTEIPHDHDGDEVSGGACFKEEKKHTHQGDASSGEGCYTKPITHVHQGNEGQEGACYQAVYHTHEDACYTNEICTVDYTVGDLIENFTDECDTCGESTFDRVSGTGSHKDCTVGVETIVMEYCQTCGPMLYTYHTYPVVICGIDTEQPTGYEKICGKEEGDVEGYETGCGMEEGQTEGYKRTCEKLVDGYEKNCGLDEETPCGRLIVTNETSGKQEKVTVSVKFEDLSGGKLIPSDNPFNWFDENGNSMGNGDQIEVEKNGNYTVELKLENRDVDESGLRSSMLVDNILSKSPDDGKETPSPSASPSSGKEETNPSPSQTPSGEGTGEDPGGDGQDDEEDTPVPTPSMTPSPIPTNDGNGQNQENPTDGDFGNRNRDVKTPEQEKEAEVKATESPTPAVTLKKETTQKKLEEKMQTAPALSQVEEMNRFKRFFSIPAVRIITIAAGTLLLLAGLFLLLLYLRKSVRLYNDDGEGRWIYLGRLIVRLEEEGYAVTISEKMEKKAYTNRYCIKPGLFRLGKGEQEVFVYKDAKRVSVCLGKEMIVVL